MTHHQNHKTTTRQSRQWAITRLAVQPALERKVDAEGEPAAARVGARLYGPAGVKVVKQRAVADR